MYKTLLLVFSVVVTVQSENACNSKEVEYGTICVCNSTYCDTVPQIETLTSGQYQLYSTSKTKLGFSSTTGHFSSTSDTASVKITVANIKDTRQTMNGIGGAFSDSAGINIVSLPEAAQEKLLESYFGNDGLEYSIGRVPIGGTDFSTRAYTYCDEEDLTLDSFALQDEDYKYKIPIIQKAQQLRGDGVFRLFASPWSSPAWTKSNNEVKGSGTLKDDYYDLWANYILKFFDAYETNNITFWGVTPQNEPYDGFSSATDIPNLYFTPSSMNAWIKDHFGPAIRNSSYSDLKIIAHDDNRDVLLLMKVVLEDEDVLKFLDGIGVHWYTNFFTPPSILELLKTDKKDLFILSTEACNGYILLWDWLKAVELGSWSRGVYYTNSILDDFEYGSSGWTDWNLVLDLDGGPSFVSNFVDAPILVNATSGEFYKQPMFYVMGHFSKFVVPNSVRVASEVSNSKIRAMVFQRPDEKIVVTISNDSDDNLNVEIDIEGSTGVIAVEAYSINTVLYTP